MTFSAQIYLRIGIGLDFEKINVGVRNRILIILWVSIFRQNRQLWLFLAQICSKMDLGLEIAWKAWSSLGWYVWQFSDKTVTSEFFHLNFVKLPNYIWYFGSNNVEDVAKKSVETEISWVELGLQFSNTLKIINYTSRATL